MTFADVLVNEDPVAVLSAEHLPMPIDDWDIADAIRAPQLSSYYEKRQRQREHPDFGRLVGKGNVYLRFDDPEDGAYLGEVTAEGFYLRIIKFGEIEAGEASTEADWPSVITCDLYDPSLPSKEITRDEFEQAWERAQSEGV
jgi:hypothetical protein